MRNVLNTFLKFWSISSSTFLIKIKTECTPAYTSSSSTVTIEFIHVIAWSDSAPRTSSGVDCSAAVVSPAAVNEWEYTTMLACCSCSAGTCERKKELRLKEQSHGILSYFSHVQNYL